MVEKDFTIRIFDSARGGPLPTACIPDNKIRGQVGRQVRHTDGG